MDVQQIQAHILKSHHFKSLSRHTVLVLCIEEAGGADENTKNVWRNVAYHNNSSSALMQNSCLPPATYLDERDQLLWMETTIAVGEKSLEHFDIGRPIYLSDNCVTVAVPVVDGSSYV